MIFTGPRRIFVALVMPAVSRAGVIPGLMSGIVEHGGIIYLAGVTGQGDDIATRASKSQPALSDPAFNADN